MSHTNIDNHGVHSVEKYALPADFQRDYELVTQKLKDYANGTSNMSLHEMTQLPHDKIMQYLILNQQTMGVQYNEFLNLFNAYYQKRYPKSIVSTERTETTKKEVQKVKADVEATKSILDSQRETALATLKKNSKSIIEIQKALNLPTKYQTNIFGPITRDALVKFQQEKGITKDLGFFGPKTYALLFPETPIVQATLTKNIKTPPKPTYDGPLSRGHDTGVSAPIGLDAFIPDPLAQFSGLPKIDIKKPVSNSLPEIKLDEAHMKDQEHVNDLIKKSNGALLAKDSTKFTTSNIFTFIKNGLWIGGEATDRYIWDEPKDGKRTIYLLDQNNGYKAKAIVDKDGKVETNTGINPKLITYQVSLKSKN